MHYHCEIAMPPTDDINAAVEKVLAPFSENNEEAYHAFWDWYVIGGRFAGRKLEASLDAKKVEAFYAELTTRNVTVSGLQAGKQKLAPASQVPMVDELWQEFFPESNQTSCPIFDHSNDQYKEYLPSDVMRVSDVPKSLTCSRIIFAADKGFSDTGIEAVEMFSTDIWNGVTWEDTAWSGNFEDAVQRYFKKTAGGRPEYVERIKLKDDWLAVTVDYHS